MALEGTQFSHYRIRQLIGRGGMGEVYLAEDTHIQRQIAAKVIRTEMVEADQGVAVSMLRLFWREATAIATLDHPHILPLYDLGATTINGSHIAYLIIPYRPEGSLASWLRKLAQTERSQKLTLKQVADFIRQAGQALQYAHDHQIMHLDVKPANFLIHSKSETDEYPDLLLSDFGIARLTNATLGSSQQVRGTPTYMAPEQCLGRPVFASDQYALAIMAYELLAGTPPFQGAPLSVMFAHIHLKPKPVREHNSLLPQAIDMVLQRALAKQPEERFPSIAAFAQAFQEACQSEEDAATLSLLETWPPRLTPPTPSGPSAGNISSGLTNRQGLNVQIPPGAAYAGNTPFPQLAGAPLAGNVPPGQANRRDFNIQTPPGAVYGGNTPLPQPPRAPLTGNVPPGLTNRQGLNTQKPQGAAYAGNTPLPQPASTTPVETRTSPQPLETASKPRTSRRTTLLLIGAAVASAGGGVGLTWLYLSRQQKPSPPVPPTLTPTSPIPVTPTAATPTQPATHSMGTTLNVYHGHSLYVYGVTWASSDGQHIASAGDDHTVQDWNTYTGQQYFSYNQNGPINDVKASHNKMWIASAGEDHTVQIHNARNGTLVSTYSGHNGAVNTVEWSPDDRYIVSAGSDRTVQVWEAANGNTITVYQEHSDIVWAAGWSPDGKLIVSGSADNTARVWDATGGATLLVYVKHTESVRSVSWSERNYGIATASEDLTVQVWNPQTGATQITYRGHTAFLRTVAWAHSSSRIVSGARDTTAQIWDGVSGQHIYTYQGHKSTVFDAQWSHDDKLIASCSTDTTVQIWQAS